MTDHFIQQQIAEFVCKYPNAAPKKEIATEMPKVAQSMTPTPMLKKSVAIQMQCTIFPKKSSESSEDSEYTKDSECCWKIAYLISFNSISTVYCGHEHQAKINYRVCADGNSSRECTALGPVNCVVC
jgi:hypothetical protein